MNRYLRIITLCLALTLFSGCAQGTAMETGPHAPVELSAWVAYWDKDRGLKEYRQIHHHLAAISCFMAYYDKNDTLLIPDETREIAAFARKKGQKKRYLSITNDWQNAEGKFLAKDTELLKRLLKNDERRKDVIQEMIDAAKELGCTGIELDYERIHKDEKILADYLDFTYQLSYACNRENLDLRIVLEPGMPMDAGLCKGPEYVVMFYNLHGGHNDPGPKADAEFIQNTLQKMEAIPGVKAAALATGGYRWEDYSILGLKKGPVRQLDEEEATSIAKKHGITPERDEKSYGLHFSYKEDGHSYEVWYADHETLNAWIKALADGGIEKVNIWRLGGNVNIKGVKN